jgi:hypothetical protein
MSRLGFTPPHSAYPYVNVGTGRLLGLGTLSPPVGFLGLRDTSIQPAPEIPIGARIFWGLASTVGTGMGAYHGWKRTHRGWPVAGWALFGMFIPIVAIPVMLAQGFGKRKGSN